MLYTITWVLVLVVPLAVLTVAGVLLFRRWRSAATAMVALGFAATLIGQVVALYESFKLSAAMQELKPVVDTHRNTLFLVAHFHAVPVLTHHVAVFGLSLAAVGLLWHANGGR